MDPEVALAQFNVSACWQALQDLDDWRARAGFRPAGVLDGDSVECMMVLGGKHAEVAERVQEWLEPSDEGVTS